MKEFKDIRFDKLIEMVRSKYENNGDPGHDYLHILRVIASCRKLGAALSADLGALLPAALLHDIINVPKNHPDRLVASQKAAEEAAGILRYVGYSEDEISKIKTIIKEHSFSLGLKPSCLESAILQDADRLDALGAVGIMRTVSCGAKMGTNYYSLIEPIAKDRILDDKKYTLDHFYVKLFKLGELFNTDLGRQEGQRRISFMESFISQLESEIKN